MLRRILIALFALVVVTVCSIPEQANSQSVSPVGPQRNYPRDFFLEEPPTSPPGLPEVPLPPPDSSGHNLNDQGLFYKLNWQSMAIQNFNTEYGCRVYQIRFSKELGTIGYNTITDCGHDAIDPSVQPMTGKVAYASNRSGTFDIWLGDPYGQYGMPERLTTALGNDYMPSFSPDGSKIAFISNRDGSYELYLMNADGSHQTRLTADPNADFSPTWSPDGNFLFWVKAVDEVHGNIMRSNSDGTGQVVFFPYLAYIDDLDISPDGKMLGFTFDSNADQWFDIGVMPIDTKVIQVKRFGYLDQSRADPFGFDYQFGSWIDNVTNTDFFQIGIEYIYYQGSWYIYRTHILQESMPNNPVYGLTFDLDIGLMDPYPPVTWIQPLPKYSRVSPGEPLYITLEANDSGNSGLKRVDVEIAYSDFDWRTYYTWQVPSSLTFPLQVPVTRTGTLYFRSKGMDDAHNIEAYPLDYDAVTRVYVLEFQGRVMDPRGLPSYKDCVTIENGFQDEPNTDRYGAYRKHSHIMVFNAQAGCGNMGFSFQTEFREVELFDWYLIPHQNLLVNPGFEDDVINPGWQVQGAQSPGFRTSARNTGRLGLAFFGQNPSEPPESRAIQTITIPEEIHNPTLAFTYNYLGETERGTFQILANSHPVFTTSQPSHGWQHEWIDMSDFAGQEVTLELVYSGVSETISQHVWLDDMTLAAWTTPWIVSVSQSTFEYDWSGAQVDLGILNYLPGTRLFVGPFLIEMIEETGQNQYSAWIPAGIPPGRYDLVIQSPGGVTAFSQPLLLGDANFLPLISH